MARQDSKRTPQSKQQTLARRQARRDKYATPRTTL